MQRKVLKEKILTLLQNTDPQNIAEEIQLFADFKINNILFSALCREEPILRWNAVKAIAYVALNKDEDLQTARIIIKRCLWNLNEESGGIGWGAAETIGEILAQNRILADQFTKIMIGYARKDVNFLEFEPLQRGLLWALARISDTQKELLKSLHTSLFILPYLNSSDITVRGLAIWLIGKLKSKNTASFLQPKDEDINEIEIFRNNKLEKITVKQLLIDARNQLYN